MSTPRMDADPLLQAERDARFAALERMRSHRPSFPEAEVEADIAEAIAEVRSRNAHPHDSLT
jgi:hypothetical protein